MSLLSPISIRTFEPEDQPRLEAIIRAAFAAGEISGGESQDIDHMARGVGSTPGSTYLAVSDGTVVGFLAADYSMIIIVPEARRQGIGSALVQTALAHHPQLELAPPIGSDVAEAFLRSVGFAPHHLLRQLDRRDGSAVDEPAAPEGFALRTYEEADFSAYHALLNRAFSDHPTPLSVSVERMRAVHARPDFDPTLILLLAPSDRREDFVGFVFVRLHPMTDGEVKGGIGMIGVDRHVRQRGFGRMLFRWGIWRLQQAGCRLIELEVVDINDRALPLYESEGFVPVQAWPYWAHHAGTHQHV